MEDGSGFNGSTFPVPPNCQLHSNYASTFSAIILQALLILTFSNFFHFFLKRLGQPSAISQMLAGIVLGPTWLGHYSFSSIKDLVYPVKDNDYLSSTATLGRMFFMFLVGLEMDIPYLLRTIRRTAIVAYGGGLVCMVMAGVFSPLIYWLTKAHGSQILFALTLMLIFSNTASPILVRMTTELKLTTSEIGRLAISSALVNDMSCLLLVATVTSFRSEDDLPASKRALLGFLALAMMAASSYVIRPIIRWLNRRNQQRKHIKDSEAIAIMIFVISVSTVTEMMGYSSMMSCFLMGLVFPREGGTARTLVDKLTYPVHNIILPIYFGYAGLQTNMNIMHHGRLLVTVVTVVVLSTVGKVVGTMLATKYLGIPLQEGLVLGLLLNVKGHVDLIVIALARKHGIWGPQTYMVLLITVLLNTLTAGPAVAIVVRKERRALKYMSLGLEWQKPEKELRVLACVHSPRDVPTMLNLIEISNGTNETPLAAYMMHLIELTQKITTTMFYHQMEDHGDEWDYGGDNARQINTAVDAFSNEIGVRIRQLTAISSFTNMHEDVCNGAGDVRASLIILPFHKRQRIDGKMRSRKDEIRGVNQKVLRHAPCSVGILVDRGLASTVQAQGPHNVVVLFIGGPDDREAVAFGSRLAIHPCVSLTLVRFLPASMRDYDSEIEMQASKDNEVLMAISNHEKERNADEDFMSNFHNRFVATGVAAYVEKKVENGPDTVTAISAMEGMYTLFLVGRGRRGISPLTSGLSEWEECPELGPIGDLLASSDFTNTGSVLVLQQHDISKKENVDDELMAL